MENGEHIPRSWLLYSVAKDATYCFCCKLFSKAPENSFSSGGYSDWNHLARLIQGHEKSVPHMLNFKTWKEFEFRLQQNLTIDSTLQKNMSKEIEHWRGVLKRLLIVVEFLAA